jgi:hypothetical protein
MDSDEKFINPVESALLSDLVDLYTCDLARQGHLPGHSGCIACSKEEIVSAILRYRDLDALTRVALPRQSSTSISCETLKFPFEIPGSSD